jgi:hypothetical protein
MNDRKLREPSLQTKLLAFFGGAGAVAVGCYDFTHFSRNLFSNRRDFELVGVGFLFIGLSVSWFLRKKIRS